MIPKFLEEKIIEFLELISNPEKIKENELKIKARQLLNEIKNNSQLKLF